MNKVFFSLPAISMLFGCTAGSKAEATLVEWEHGWKTESVVATRYKNPTFGYNIGFTFPRHPNNGDRAELFDYISQHDGWVMEGGGYPGAPLYTKFKGVVDKETANVKIKEVLPGLEQLINSF